MHQCKHTCTQVKPRVAAAGPWGWHPCPQKEMDLHRSDRDGEGALSSAQAPSEGEDTALSKCMYTYLNTLSSSYQSTSGPKASR